MAALKVKEIMTEHPVIINPSQTVKEAAQCMKNADCGVLPVGDEEKVVGMITDRDITLRVTAEGKDPARTRVDEVMTKHVYCCDEDDDIQEAVEEMRKHNVARLVVTKGKNKRATGIVNMTCLMREGELILSGLLNPRRKGKVTTADGWES